MKNLLCSPKNNSIGTRQWVFLLFLFFSLGATAQQTVRGVVKDATGETLPGVSIVETGTTNGTISDFDGSYEVTIADGGTLTFTYVGYASQTISPDGSGDLNITLQTDSEVLDEVVVVGYGSQRKAEITGAVSSVGGDEISALPVTSVEQGLQGRAAGVTVINNGAPGTDPTVRIRGLGTINNNNPLYVIDGVIASGIGDLNPLDIESIEILKDASTAAVYGAKGSNGVVIVTTKDGRRDGGNQVSFNSYVGTQWTDQRFDVLNTDQYITYATEAFGAPERITDPQYSDLLENNTNWQDEVFQSGFIQNYNLSLSGGGQNSNYRISGGYLSQDGVLKTTGLKRYNLRANSTFDVGRLTIGENLSVAYSTINPESENGGRSILEHTIKMAPYFPVYNPNNPGGYQGPNSAIDGQDAENPVRILELGSRENNTLGIVGNIFAEFEIVKGLSFRSQFGTEYRNYDFEYFRPSYNDDSEGGTHMADRAAIRKSTGSLLSVIFTNSLTYRTTFADNHNLEVLLLAEQTDSDNKTSYAASDNFITDDVNQLSNVNANVNSAFYEYKRLGFLGRLNYNFKEKYLLAATIRRDASSRFGPDNRWGTFPSVAAGWRISEEPFMQGSGVSNLKLRASWGVTGNDNIADYGYLTGIESNFHYPIQGNDAVGATASGLANSQLKWEETTMTNIGLDFAFMDYAITGSVEYYINQSDDLLIPLILPVSSGFHNGTVIENVGSVETKGFEFNLGYNHYGQEFTWSASVNLGTSKNEVLDLGENESINGAEFETENISRTVVGESAFQFYGWEFDGIFQTQEEVESHAGGSQGTNLNAAPGDFRIVDQNEDGVINDDDRTFIGNPFPELTYGLNLSAGFAGFDFSLFINGVAGNDVYNTNLYDLEGMPRLFNAGTAVLDRWTGPGTSNTVPRAGGAATNTQVSSRFVEDGSFTRLRNITLGYDLARSVLKNKIPRCRVYISATNLITFTDYSGLDPEVGAYTRSQLNVAPTPIGGTATNNNGQPTGNFENGIDRGNYPVPKSFIGGIEITF